MAPLNPTSTAPTPATPKHIDRARLYTDTYYRFTYVSEFAQFNESDIAALKASAPLVAPLVPTIVDKVYEHLFSFDITKGVFLQRNQGFEGQLASDLDHLVLDSDQIKFRKDFLGKYLVKLVTGSYDKAFVTYLDWVGKIHTDTPSKKSKINVEYIHVNALFAWLHGFLIETLDAHPALQADPEGRAKTLAALSKLLWIQNDLFARYYVRDGAEFTHGTVARRGLSLIDSKAVGWLVGLAAAAAAVGYAVGKSNLLG
ncbi:hypothetical protein SpCBS45565_g06807 [Spizellomyces sp. 'palustris']|nr:hypothetical protein SpCBS45565_g06807 [Spizellomyces sp. 'palustris']